VYKCRRCGHKEEVQQDTVDEARRVDHRVSQTKYTSTVEYVVVVAVVFLGLPGRWLTGLKTESNKRVCTTSPPIRRCHEPTNAAKSTYPESQNLPEC